MTNVNAAYTDLIRKVLASDVEITSRGEKVKRIIYQKYEFDSFPLVTTRATAWVNALREWEWFMSGSSDINDLHENVRHWWNPWADEEGMIPYNYGEQFRRSSCFSHDDNKYRQFDQIAWLLDAVKTHPFSRRNVISAWNTGEMAQPDCPISNCHGTTIQVFGRAGAAEVPNRADFPGVRVETIVLDMVMYQRSCDVIVGLGANWVQYWAFLLWLCHRTGCRPGKFTWVGGDVHVYAGHYEVAGEIAANTILHHKPGLIYTPSSDEFLAKDFRTNGVFPPAVATKVAMVVGGRK